MSDEFTCAHCRGTFLKEWTEEEMRAEAEATFTSAELADVDVVCEDCWREMRAAMPDLDRRYT